MNTYYHFSEGYQNEFPKEDTSCYHSNQPVFQHDQEIWSSRKWMKTSRNKINKRNHLWQSSSFNSLLFNHLWNNNGNFVESDVAGITVNLYIEKLYLANT